MPNGKIVSAGNTLWCRHEDKLFDWICTGMNYENLLNAISVKSVTNVYPLNGTLYTNPYQNIDNASLNIGTLSFNSLCLIMVVYVDIHVSAAVNISRRSADCYLKCSIFESGSNYGSSLISQSGISSTQTITNTSTGTLVYECYLYTNALASKDSNSGSFTYKSPIQNGEPLVGLYMNQTGYAENGNTITATITGSVTIKYIYI